MSGDLRFESSAVETGDGLTAEVPQQCASRCRVQSPARDCTILPLAP
jgi:hypothetical protein